MKIEIIPCLNDNYSYLIFEKETNTVSIVDPSEFNSCDRIVQKYKKLDYILNTHHHFDHVDGNLKLKKRYNSKVIGFDKDKERIPGIDIKLKDNQEFKIGDLKFKVIFVPGHTNGHIAFYFEKEKVLFSGDTLFSLGCGKIFEGTHKDMFNSLNKLKSLSPDTKIYCGHEYTESNLAFAKNVEPLNENIISRYNETLNLRKQGIPSLPSTIGAELQTNPFLRVDTEEVQEMILKKFIVLVIIYFISMCCFVRDGKGKLMHQIKLLSLVIFSPILLCLFLLQSCMVIVIWLSPVEYDAWRNEIMNKKAHLIIKPEEKIGDWFWKYVFGTTAYFCEALAHIFLIPSYIFFISLMIKS